MSAQKNLRLKGVIHLTKEEDDFLHMVFGIPPHSNLKDKKSRLKRRQAIKERESLWKKKPSGWSWR